MQNSERDRANLQRHMHEAEARAAIGGHQLSAWEQAKPGLFTWEAVCTRCGEKVQAGAMTLVVTLERTCPETDHA